LFGTVLASPDFRVIFLDGGKFSTVSPVSPSAALSTARIGFLSTSAKFFALVKSVLSPYHYLVENFP